MGDLSQILASINAVLWNETWIFIIAGTGVLFTFWSGFCQYRALTHGPKVVRGVYDDPDDPGANNHIHMGGKYPSHLLLPIIPPEK